MGYYGPLAQAYDVYRPRPPVSLVGLLCCLARLDTPERVVDLGSGTGLSTEIWAARAVEAIGVEPDERMRALAIKRAPRNVRYVDGVGPATGLDSSCADIVTACCALHWMEPEPTLAEVARILRPSGAFATCDVVGRSIDPRIDPALSEIERRIEAFGPLESDIAGRAERIRSSGDFRFVCELMLTSEERGDADRVVGLVLAHGQVSRHLESGEWTEKGLGLHKLRRRAKHVLGDRTVPFVFRYHTCLAVRS